MITTALAGRASMPANRCAGQRLATRQPVHSRAWRVIRLVDRTGRRRAQSTNSGTAKTRAAEEPRSGNGNGAQPNGATAAANATAQTIPIPGNGWLAPFQIPLRQFAAMNRRRPYTTQLVSTLVIWVLGDVTAQYITSPAAPSTAPGAGQRGLSSRSAASDSSSSAASDRSTKEEEETGTPARAGTTFWQDQYDGRRTARALIIGGTVSIPAYRWFLWLGESFNGFTASRALRIGAKVAINQLAFTPVFNAYFFAMHAVLGAAMGDGDGDGRRRGLRLLRPREVWDRVRRTVPTSWLDSCKVWPAVTAFSFWAVPVELRSLFAGVVAIGWQTYLGVLNQRAARMELVEAAAAERATSSPASLPASSMGERTAAT